MVVMYNGVKHLLEFGPFQIDPERRLLLRNQQPVSLSSKAFDLLLALTQRAGQVVFKDDLMKLLWPDTFVEESNLGQHVFQLRKALGERPQDHTYIVTVPGRGYRFAQTVRTVVVDEDERKKQRETREDTEDQIVVASRSLQSVVIEGANGASSSLTLVPRPQRAKSAIAFAAITALVVVGYVAWRQLYLRAHASKPDRVMLAVLPFQNLTGDPDQEYFADGLTEEMITKLGGLHPEQLGVIARTSVMGYKHSNERLDQIGRELAVQYVLEGSYRHAADHLRITAQLIRVKDQSHLWADEYDRQPQDILNVQDEVALSIAQEIRLRLTPQQSMRLTAHVVSPEAHEDYLKGRFFWNKRTADGFRKAIEFFQAAIVRDPNYAEAYAGMADAYLLLGGYGFEPQKDTMPKAKQSALRAVQIDDTLAEPYTSLGLIYVGEWNWAEAERSYKRAIELNPNYSVAHHWYGAGYLAAIPSKTEEMISELRKAHELDPLSPMITTDLGAFLCYARRYDEGMKELQEVLKLDPDFDQAHYRLSEAYELQGMYPEAIAEIQKIKSPDASRYVNGQLGQIYALQGRRREALEVVSQLQKLSGRTYVDPVYTADIYIALGEKDLAFVWLEKAYEEHSPAINGLRTRWEYEPIRSDPRFADLVRRVGLL
jgi:TolB-like protein/DNA-binding winged helix-turn-helix (wHTH) protein/Flp pilus assembly protein TadD